jgi:hypothetical protein
VSVNAHIRVIYTKKDRPPTNIRRPLYFFSSSSSSSPPARREVREGGGWRWVEVGGHHLRETAAAPSAVAISANAPDSRTYRGGAPLLRELVAPRTSLMPEWP